MIACFPNTSTRITPDSLTEIGYTPEFLKNNCFFIGSKEYEDSFATEDIVALLNIHWPKENGEDWFAAEIDQFRNSNYKFSEGLKMVRKTCVKKQRNNTQKPEFAQIIETSCKQEAQIPQVIRNIFSKLRVISGVNHNFSSSVI